MSQGRTWSLSQDANKSSGVCSVCHATRQLHLRDGTVHKHGPRDNPCPGSHKPPLSLSSGGSPGLSQQPPGPDAAASTSCGPSVQPGGYAGVACAWSPADWALIKHIPKSARAPCARHLAGLLRSAAAHPETIASWLAIFNWGGTILCLPKRGDRSHNLSSCIKQRVADYSPSVCMKPEVDNPPKRRTGSPASQLAQAVAAKLEDGNVKAAIRLLVSDDTPV